MSEQARQDLENRKRLADLSKLTAEQVSQIAEEMGKRIGRDIDCVLERAKAMLSLYGLDIKIYYTIHHDEPANQLSDEAVATAKPTKITKKTKTKVTAKPAKKAKKKSR